DGESLAAAIRRGPRPIPAVMSLVRDLLGALEHAHARGIIMRRITPTTLMLDLAGRAIITDLRYANWCLAHVPAGDGAGTEAFSAPEVRGGGGGEPASDVYGVGAIVYYALTAQEPAPDPVAVTPPRQLRPAIPAVMERDVRRAPPSRPAGRHSTATALLEGWGRRAAVVHEGVGAGPEPGPAGGAAGPAPGGPRRAAARRGTLSARARPRPRSGAPGLEAREHAHRAGRPPAHHGLRPRPGAPWR